MSSPLRQRLGIGLRQQPMPTDIADASVMARALMYLLVAVGTAVVASVAIPHAPLHRQHAVPILAAIAYAAAIGVFFGFERMPAWCIHVLLLGVTALISWSAYASGQSGSPYTIFFVWVAIYASFFFDQWGTALHVGAMLIGLGVALIELGHRANDAALHWALSASALILLAVAIQALIGHVARLVARLQGIGRTDSATGLYNSSAFRDMLENEVERARRSGNRLGVVIAELDAGAKPELLQSVGAIFRDTPRQIDTCARVGANRFGMLLPYTDEHGAHLLGERIRERVAALDGGHARISIGIAGFPRAGASAAIVIQAAENALAEARAAGGDRVMAAQRSASGARVEIDTDADMPDVTITRQPLS